MKTLSRLADKIRSREPMLGIWMQIPHPSIAEILAQSGADFVLIDGEHGPTPPEALGGLLPAVELYGTPALYRVRWNRIDLIKAALDHGVSGIMVPMVNSAEDARNVVAAAKYPPQGKRGFGAWRASNFYLDEETYFAAANKVSPVVIQIETKEALEDLDAIASTPGLDALFIGPFDLALSLGIPTGQLHPDLLAACRRVADAAKKHGLTAGIDVASMDFVATFRELGFTILTYGVDIAFVSKGARDVVADFQKEIGK